MIRRQARRLSDISVSSSRTCPSSAGCTPARASSKVVFPAPLPAHDRHKLTGLDRQGHVAQHRRPAPNASRVALAEGDPTCDVHLDRLVHELKDGGRIRTALIERAFRTVERHLFLRGFSCWDPPDFPAGPRRIRPGSAERGGTGHHLLGPGAWNAISRRPPLKFVLSAVRRRCPLSRELRHPRPTQSGPRRPVRSPHLDRLVR
jgi:hypothetical protein